MKISVMHGVCLSFLLGMIGHIAITGGSPADYGATKAIACLWLALTVMWLAGRKKPQKP